MDFESFLVVQNIASIIAHTAVMFCEIRLVNQETSRQRQTGNPSGFFYHHNRYKAGYLDQRLLRFSRITSTWLLLSVVMIIVFFTDFLEYLDFWVSLLKL